MKSSDNRFVEIYTFFRGVAGMVFVPLWTGGLSLVVIGLGVLRQWERQTWVMNFWCRGILRFYGVKVVARGFENLPAAGGGILTFNHQSHFDIPALTSSTLRTVRYGAKIELFSIPIFGQAMAAAGSLPIARNNRAKVLKIYKNAIKRFGQGFIFALAPEGTRQSQPAIGAFKRGPFIFACSSDVPIIPLVIEGADRVLAKGGLVGNRGAMSRTIQVECLPPIWAKQKPASIGDDLPDEVVVDLLNRTRQAMEEKFNSLRAAALSSSSLHDRESIQ